MTIALVEKISPGNTIITANSRLTRIVNQEYAALQTGQGTNVWQTPDVVPFSGWLKRVWGSLIEINRRAVIDYRFGSSPGNVEDGGKHVILLSTSQELFLWEKIISNASSRHNLVHTAGTAKLARDAWHLMHQWELTKNDFTGYVSEDISVFNHWVAEYCQLSGENAWIDSALLPSVISNNIALIRSSLGNEIIFAGFDELNPQICRMIQALEKDGINVSIHKESGIQARQIAVPAATQEDEMRLCAQWAREKLEKNIKAKIGIVIHDLQNRRREATRVLDEILVPGSNIIGVPTTTKPYNLSLGLPLSSYPIIKSALLYLELAETEIPVNKVSLILRSVFLGGAKNEISQRCLLDVQLRKYGETDLDLSTIIFFSGQKKDDGVDFPYTSSLLESSLNQFKEYISELPKRLKPSQWVENTSKLLSILGWPGDRVLNSDEYQTFCAWNKLLASFSSLDVIWDKLSLASFRAKLARLASTTVFQPESDHRPVQVMGMLEATGQIFDHLWVTGLNDSAWPHSPNPNPFIPYSVQKDRNLPGHSASRELLTARKILKRISGSSPEVIVSYALNDKDGSLQPSLLIKDLVQANDPQVAPASPDRIFKLLFDTSRLEKVVDDHGPVYKKMDSKGGSYLFKLQAACPFRAFSELRLGAVPIESPQPGLDAKDKGTLVHLLMQAFWRKVISQKRLMELNQDSLAKLVEDLIDRVVDQVAQHKPKTFTRNFIKLEKERLNRLLQEWIQHEKARKSFEILELEKSHQFSVGSLVVNTKIDRIDRLEDGKLVVIDYKTGYSTPNQWVGKRPDEPQLPLYAMALDKEPEALLFAQLKPGDMKYKGLVNDDLITKGVRKTLKDNENGELLGLTEWIEQWRTNLSSLAGEYRDGVAAVKPKSYPTTCQYCSLTPFCRINEQSTIDCDLPGEN